MDRLEKQKLFYKGYFLGNNMLQSYKALELAGNYHTGKRKDGQQEVSHQFEIASYLAQILIGKFPTEEIDDIIASAFLHDLVEDYPGKYSLDDIRNNFNLQIYQIVDAVTKEPGFDKSNAAYQEYFENILQFPGAVIIKGVDRIHNIQTMVHAFSVAKQKKYIHEVETFFFPMLKKARKLFPKFYLIYISIAHMLERQIFFINEIITLRIKIEEK